MTTAIRESWLRLHAHLMSRETGLPSLMAGREAENPDRWASTLRPDSTVGRFLDDVLGVAAGEYTHPYVRQLLAWCAEYADLADTDARWGTKWSGGHQDLMRGSVLQSGAYAHAWLADSALDESRIVAAATLLENNAIDIGMWASPEQSQLIEASQLHLIAGDATRARAALSRRKRYKDVALYLAWYVRVLDALEAGDRDAARGAFDEWFDVVRRADWEAPRRGSPGWFIAGNRTTLLLRLALIRRLHIERKPLAGGWRDVIASIAGN